MNPMAREDEAGTIDREPGVSHGTKNEAAASAIEDIDYYRKNERKMISDGIALFLTHDANVETKRRKPMRPNRIARWELRVADFRVFYEFEHDDVIKVVAVGHKEHNDLYIRGKRIEL